MKHWAIVGASLLATPAFSQGPVVPPAPADLALGTDIAAKLLPNGTYERMMGGVLSKAMAGMTDQMGAAPLAPFLTAAGLPASDAPKLDHATIKQIMDIVDPAYQRRVQAIMPVMMGEMGKIMSRFEPEMRAGLAQAYATHFTSAQLGDIDRFLNTPSGLAFAAQNMTIASDPAVMQKMQAMMPTLVREMPGIMQKAMAAAAGLPKPKTPQTLTDAERTKLALLLGVARDRHEPPALAIPAKIGPDMPPTPIGDVGRFFGPDYYPPAALRAESQGRVVAAVGVGADGKVRACSIESSSGSGVLDATTCTIATNTILFRPATDHDGRPIAGVYRLAVRWVLPKASPAVPTVDSAPPPANP